VRDAGGRSGAAAGAIGSASSPWPTLKPQEGTDIAGAAMATAAVTRPNRSAPLHSMWDGLQAMVWRIAEFCQTIGPRLRVLVAPKRVD
jgi:hypothetical protein